MSNPPPRNHLYRYTFLVLSGIVIALSLPSVGHAATTQPAKKTGDRHLGHFGQWDAWQSTTPNGVICYMSLKIQSTAPSSLKHRSAPYLMVTHRPSEGSTDVISYMAGYSFKPETEATLQVDKQSFHLFTDKDTAWAREAKTDHAIAKALRAGTNVSVTATPSDKKTKSMTDKFIIPGADAAYIAMSDACAVSFDPLPKKKTPATTPPKTVTQPTQKKPAPADKKQGSHEPPKTRQ